MRAIRARTAIKTTADVLLRSLPGQLGGCFLLVAAVIRLIRPDQSLVWWLVQSVFWTALGAGIDALRRRGDRSAMGGVSAGEHLSVEHGLQHGLVPADPAERAAMHRLVIHRRRRMGRYSWLFGPLLVLMFAPPVLGVLLGAWTPAMALLVFAIVFDSWMLWLRGRNLDRLERMDRALSAAANTPAMTHH
ncbi:hypothetical protein [Streptomyces sp. NBC_00370]|uniref:hypothetical protein n=1 Tax=Streptomyces sp. NBC_00370 TaxID=2975728 RepID=UPI002E2612CA